MPRRHTGTFAAFDKDGREYTIVEYAEFFDSGTLDGPSGETATGRKFFQTANGKHVNQLGKGKYEIVGLPSIPITSDDPNAP
jgi:hypothetical protein